MRMGKVLECIFHQCKITFTINGTKCGPTWNNLDDEWLIYFGKNSSPKKICIFENSSRTKCQLEA